MNFRALSFVAIAAFMGVAHWARADFQGLERVLSAVTLSFLEGETDRAVLVANEDSVDLYIYLSLDEANPDTPVKAALVKKAAAWKGGMAGQRPWLEISTNGSLQIKSENESIGRHRWNQAVTVVYRDKEFVVAGVTYSERDTLNLEAGGSCDLNLLTGKGLRNGKPVETKLRAVKLADWSDEKLPNECKF